MSDDQLERALDDVIDELVAAERSIAARRVVLHRDIEILRAERDRRRREVD